MGDIVTFYSYKGGVGRSMALANIAYLLAKRGLKVLVVDWDLEAPGIERYFSYFEMSAGGPGLMRLLVTAKENNQADYRAFTCSVASETPQPITLLTSGREQDEEYSRSLESFDWSDFFAAGGGEFIERLRDAWRADFDIVLIDSRTGLSDSGGVCTIQLPDAVVAIFTANYQSLYGVRDVLRLAQKARQRLAHDRMPLSVLPLPSRWGIQEFQETQVWLDRSVDAVQEFFADWLPRPIKPRQVLEAIKVPHSSYFSFGERLAAVEQSTTDPQGVGFSYARVAAFLASRFGDITALIGSDAVEQANREEPVAVEPAPNPLAAAADIDVLVSFEKSSFDWTELLVIELRRTLSLRLGRPVNIFFDTHELELGASVQQLAEALQRSRVLLQVLTPRFSTSKFADFEYREFRRLRPNAPIFAVVLQGELPKATMRTVLDFRTVSRHRGSRSSQVPQWHTAIDRLTEMLSGAISSTRIRPDTDTPNLSY
jgi:MinD-like ATPase involved in chromosome partitioning or flagellar assembly